MPYLASLLPRSRVNQDATRDGAANTLIYANHVGGNNEYVVMHRIGIFGSRGGTGRDRYPWCVLTGASQTLNAPHVSNVVERKED